MAKKKAELHAEIRNRFLALVTEILTAGGEEVLRTKSNEIALPCTDEEGNDEYIVISFKVPTGSRDGDPYDGYSEAESYAIAVREAEAKRKADEAKKAKKIAKDEKARQAKADAKAKREGATDGDTNGENKGE